MSEYGLYLLLYSLLVVVVVLGLLSTNPIRTACLLKTSTFSLFYLHGVASTVDRTTE